MDKLDEVTLISENDMVLLAEKQRQNGFEPKVRSWLKKNVSGKNFLDIGAYSGFYSILAIKNGANRVDAFEANKTVYDRLILNLRHNEVKPVYAHRLAVSDFNGQSEFYIKDGFSMTSSGSLIQKESIKPSKTSVKTITLDDFIELSVDIMKIDVESAEMSVLRGAKNIIQKNSPVIIIELLNDNALKEAKNYLNQISKYKYKSLDDGNYLFTPVKC